MTFRPGLGGNLFVNQIVTLFAITGSVFITRRFFDRRSISSLGLKINSQVLKDLGIGIMIPMFMMGLIYLILWTAGWLDFQGFAWGEDSFGTIIYELVAAFIIFVFVGWNEELLSRGYHLQTLESGLNTIWAVLLSSAVFGVLHLANPNADSVLNVAIGIFLAGVFLAFGFLRTRQLWLPIGLHIGWNFFEGIIFGFPVSGLETYRLTLITIRGPKLWTGGAFGPEAGLVLIPALVLGFVLVYLYTRGRLEMPLVTADQDSDDQGDNKINT
ncbi:lysostaphin resistance A-like protein [Chloroflexota bacterium]